MAEKAKDPYEVLGVERTASKDAIRRAYRKLAKKYHPDLNPDDKSAEERFKDIAQAYDILGDEEKRKRFDRGEIDATGAERPEPQYQYYRHYADRDAESPYMRTGGFEEYIDLSELFGEAFARQGAGRGWAGAGGKGGAGGAQVRIRGADVRYHMEIDFLEAVRGGRKRVTMPDGTTLDIKIPAGIADGQTLRLKGKGTPGIGGGAPGDALVSITVRPHKFFRRAGNDILLDLPITLDEAVLGAKVAVPTITGRVNVTIPKGASTGKTLRLRGKGIQAQGAKGGKSSSGDQLVRLEIVLPEKIDPELEACIRTWREKHRYNPRRNLEVSE